MYKLNIRFDVLQTHNRQIGFLMSDDQLTISLSITYLSFSALSTFRTYKPYNYESKS